MRGIKPLLWTVGGIAFIAAAGILWLSRADQPTRPRLLASLPSPLFGPKISRAEIAQALGRKRIQTKELDENRLSIPFNKKNLLAELTIDKSLQEKIEQVYERYDPAYAAFVALDPNTGKILALVDHSSGGHEGNLALRASYPAASVFKLITSAAALDEAKIGPHSLVSFNGSPTTLYKRNLKDSVNRWTRFISVEDALAHSVNTVFGKIAINRLGAKSLQKYANNFGFNQPLDFDLPLDSASALIPEDLYGLAESGSGFTRRQTLNPILGSTIAAAIISDGVMPAPYLVEKVEDEKGNTLFHAQRRSIGFPIEKSTARQLSLMMENTILRGTARKQYRDYNHHPVLSKVFIGAKTGSLSGDNPEGKYDWFVGFAQSSENPKKKFAYASLIVNKQVWKVKSAYVAREAIIEYFRKNGI